MDGDVGALFGIHLLFRQIYSKCYARICLIMVLFLNLILKLISCIEFFLFTVGLGIVLHERNFNNGATVLSSWDTSTGGSLHIPKVCGSPIEVTSRGVSAH